MKCKLSVAAAILLISAAVQAQTAAPTAAAAPATSSAPKYGVVSLIGDSVTITGSQPTTGSRLDKNEQRSLTIPDAGFDATALRTIEETIKKIAPQSATMLFAIKAPKWVETPKDLFDGDKIVMSPKLIEAMKADGATHLLLLTRQRSEAKLKFENGWEGSGRVDGPGFYIDRAQPVVNLTTGDRSRGYLGVYLSLRLSLVDLSTSMVIGRQPVENALVALATRKQEGVDPWDSINPAEKMTRLNSMIESTLQQALPELLKAR